MSFKNNFTEDDKKKVVDFLNTVATNATFNMKTEEIIQYFKLLSFMQQTLLPKINQHILEVKRIIEAPENAAEVAPEVSVGE